MPNVDPLTVSSDITVANRQTILSGWLDATLAVANASGDNEAKAIAAFIRDRVTVGVPRPDNDLAYVPRPELRKHETLIVVPMLTIDYLLLPTDDYWRRFASPGQGQDERAEFYVPTKAIYLSGELPRAALEIGLLLLHEGLHAYDHLIRGEHMPKPFWRRERNAQLLEMRILRRHGGAELSAYLDRLEPSLAQWLHDSDAKETYVVPSEFVEDSQLDQLLWPVASRDARRERSLDLARCAVVHYLEKTFGLGKGRTVFGKYIRTNFVDGPSPQHLLGLHDS